MPNKESNGVKSYDLASVPSDMIPPNNYSFDIN